METDKKKEPRGIRNNNPLNIRKGNNWKGERPKQTDPAFEEFESMEMGIRAAIKLIRNKIQGKGANKKPLCTIRLLVSSWAPPCENKTELYIRFVSSQTGILPAEIIHHDDRRKIIAIARAMAFYECGEWIDEKIFESAYDLL